MLALDIGTSSVRTFLGTFDGKELEVAEKYRFYHGPVEMPGSVCWAMSSIYQRLEEGLDGICREARPESMTLDAWGTDMVAFDRCGELLTDGISTRDRRFIGLKERFFQRFDRGELYRRTGIQFLDWNTVYLLYDYASRKPRLMDAVDKFLFAPDAFLYFLTGEMICDYTIASTSQMLNPVTRMWDAEIVKATGVAPDRLLTPRMGASVGQTRHSFGGQKLQVFSGCSHDTAAAVAGVPSGGGSAIYLICGSWAMMGMELDAPVITPLSQRYAVSNEGGADGRIRYLKNVMGMWLIQESRRQWQREGKAYSFAELAQLGAQAEPFARVFDVDDPRLRPSGDIPGVIRSLCLESGQTPPQTVGEVVRCIDDSLALRFRVVRRRLEQSSGQRSSILHMVAGGSQDALLCQNVADATGLVVQAGPAEASAFGCCAVQLVESGEARDLREARDIERRSIPLRVYEPRPNEALEAAFCARRTLFEGV